ncbi:MAG: hypothetical protein QXG97_00860 [Nitrososphaerota archaeon]
MLAREPKSIRCIDDDETKLQVQIQYLNRPWVAVDGCLWYRRIMNIRGFGNRSRVERFLSYFKERRIVIYHKAKHKRPRKGNNKPLTIPQTFTLCHQTMRGGGGQPRLSGYRLILSNSVHQ